MTWQAVGCRHLGFGARIPRFGLRGLLSRSFLHETKTRGSRHNWMSDNKERRKLRPGKGKYVPEGTPAAWFMLDRARFDILPAQPSITDIFAYPDVRSAYEILSRLASDVLHKSRQRKEVEQIDS